MKPHRVALTMMMLLLAPTPGANGQVRVIPEVRWQPEQATTPTKPRVTLMDSANRPVTNVNGEFVVHWDPITRETLVLALRASLDEPLPSPYSAQALELQIPYYFAQNTINLVLAPSAPDGSAKAARRLYSRVVPTMSLASLMAFYQEARGAAAARMDSMQGDWRRLDDYTVQVVYKFLQASLWLSKKEPRVVVRDRRVTEAREWLGDALANNRRRVGKALGSDLQAEQLLGELEESEGALLGHVWRAILRESEMARRCQLLEFFRKDAAGVHVHGIHAAHVLSAQAQCYVVQYKSSTGADSTVEARLRQLVGDMRLMLRSQAVPPQAEQHLRSDISTIDELLEAIRKEDT